MRVLVIQPGPRFSVEDVYAGWVKALRKLGVQVGCFNFSDRLDFYENAYHYEERLDCWVNPFTTEQNILLAGDGLWAETLKGWPDVILIVSGFYVPIEFVIAARARGIKIVYLFTESPYEDDTQAPRAEQADLVILNDPTNLDRFPNGYYQPHSYDPDIHYPGQGARPHDFSFVGTGYESRVEFFEAVRWGDLDVRFEGNWPVLSDPSPLDRFIAGDPEACMFNTDTADLYRASEMTANLYRRESNRPDLSAGEAMGPREVEAAACETFLFRDPRPESDEVLGMLPSFGSVEEFSDLLAWWSSHPDARREAACKSRSAIADRTFENAARRFLSTIEKVGT